MPEMPLSAKTDIREMGLRHRHYERLAIKPEHTISKYIFLI